MEFSRSTVVSRFCCAARSFWIVNEKERAFFQRIARIASGNVSGSFPALRKANRESAYHSADFGTSEGSSLMVA